MSTTKTASDALSRLGASAKSIIKMAIQSRPARRSLRRAAAHAGGQSKSIYILGNGPSLAADLAEHSAELAQGTCMAVNFAANAPGFMQLRPAYYVLIDPLFFSPEAPENVRQLWGALAAVDWPMALIVPASEAPKARKLLGTNENVAVAVVNTVGVEGWQWLERLAYDRAWGMPRPRNVLVPSIMAAAAMGFEEIYLLGADHSWMQTISVDEENHVVSIQPHFYKDDSKELARTRRDYMHRPLHDVVESFAVAFRSYHRLQQWAAPRGLRVYNATPGSFIDAFPRRRPWQ